MSRRSASSLIALVALALLSSGALGSTHAPALPLGQIGVDPVPPMISNFTMETPDKNPLREIRISINISDYNGFEDISMMSISLYYFNDLQASARYTQYEDNTSVKIDRFEDTFGGFLDTTHSDVGYIKSSNWIEENTTLRIEFYFKPVPATDVRLFAKDRTDLSIFISTSISPSARPSKIKEAYIPWMIALVIASIIAVALLWIRNSSNRLAKIAEESKRRMGTAPIPAGTGDTKG